MDIELKLSILTYTFVLRKIPSETKCLNPVNYSRNGVSTGLCIKGKNMYEYLSRYHEEKTFKIIFAIKSLSKIIT